MNFRGLDLSSPVNRLKAGFAALAVNVRAYALGSFMLRNLLTNAVVAVSGAITTLARLNDSTPAGPSSGYTLISLAGTTLYNNTTPIATGMSGNPVSMLPFRPNLSVRPVVYIGDVPPSPSALEAANNCVTLSTTSLFSGSSVTFPSNRMLKVSSTGVVYKMGVKEPQLAPTVSTENTNQSFAGSLLATAIPWTNQGGANPDFDYGESNGYPHVPTDGTPPFTVDVLNATTVTISSISGSATINGGTKTPTSLGPTIGLTNPGGYIRVSGTGLPPATATVVTGAFIDASGNVMPLGVAPLYIPTVVDVGASVGSPIKVPVGAVTFQIGINSTGNTFSANSGSFSIAGVVTTDALSQTLGVIGNLTLNYWQDSPTSGAVADYIWCNPGDPGGGTPRTISDAVGSNSGNSFIFDASFGSSASPPLAAGIPGLPGIGSPSSAMIWSQLNADESVSGTVDVSPAQSSNFNFCLYGNIYIPAAGDYTFVLTYKDDVIWGIEGATLVSAPTTQKSYGGQTITVVKGYPLLPRVNESTGTGGGHGVTTVVVSFAAAGVYGLELDYDYWYHSGRILLLMGSPTPGAPAAIIPPGAANQRQQVQFFYRYRSSATGARSNNSPPSAAITLPVSSNTVKSLWSNDPQIDLVDYFTRDSATSAFTYCATGPNDNAGGGGTNTPIVNSLTDTQLGNELAEYDNYEPFPSIDLPQKGTCTVSGGVITWVSGGAIGGTATGFNTRWLADTVIVIGTPTGLAYTLIARPTSTSSMTIPGVPDSGTAVQYTISEPILAAQPLPYLWGPSDNIPFACGCGDPLRPGTMYWCKGNNLDSAPDTNQQDLTDPSEPLVNGCYSGGRGIVFTIRRAIAVSPNFFNAQATATGTTGSTWSVRETAITRGLFIPRCLAVSGGGNIFFRVNDGWHISAGGGASKSITDETLYPLFPHENSTPQPVVRNGVTIWPPDDSLPQKQKAVMIGAYLYWDYVGSDGNQHTLVFDEAAMGWIWDINSPPVTARASNDAVSVQGVLCGCSDGTIRQLSSTSSAVETATATVVTGAIGGKGYGHVGAMVVEYSSLLPITLNGIAADVGNGSYGFNTITLPATGGAITKLFLRPTPNKTKLIQFAFSFTDPAAQIDLDGSLCYVRAWGSDGPYQPIPMFSVAGGEG
jgi:hypothetical protein